MQPLQSLLNLHGKYHMLLPSRAPDSLPAEVSGFPLISFPHLLTQPVGILFIEGPRREKNGDFVPAIQDEYMSRSFMLRVLSYQFFVSSMLLSPEVIDCEEFVRFILETARETKFKEESIHYFDELAQKILGLTIDL